MVASFAEIAQRDDFRQLPPESKQQLRNEFFQKRVASRPEFQQLPQPQQVSLQQEFDTKYDIPEIRPKRQNNIEVDPNIQGVIDLNRRQLDQVAPPPTPNAMSDFTGGFTNAISGYNRDDLVRQSGGGFASGAGTLAGSALPFLAVTGGLGAINPVAGAAGAFGIGAELSFLNDLQQQRLEGKEGLDLGRGLGSAGIGGLESAIPGVGKGLSLIPRIALNAGIQGGAGALGSVAQQAVEQKTFNPELSGNRIASQALLGAAGGGVEGFLTKPPDATPQLDINTPSGRLVDQPKIEVADTKLQDISLTPEQQIRASELTESFNQRTRPDQVDIAQPVRQEIVTPDKLRAENEQAALNDLSSKPIVEQVNDDGLVVARRGESQNQPQQQIEISKPDFPQGQPIEISKPLETQQIINPETGRPYTAQQKRLRNSADIATNEAFKPQIEIGRTDLPAGRAVETDINSRQPMELNQPRQSVEIGTPRQADTPSPSGRQPVDILGPDGTPARRPLDIGGKQVEVNQQRPVDVNQTRQPVDMDDPVADETFFQRQDLAPERQQAAQAEIQQSIDKSGGDLITFAEAERFVRDNGTPEQMSALQTYIESGKRNQLFDFDYNPKEKPGDIRKRQLAPIAFEKRRRKVGTEVTNIKKAYKNQSGSVDYNAAIDATIQRIKQFAPDAEVGLSRTKTGKLKAQASQLTDLVKQLDTVSGGRALTDIYLHGVNVGQSSRQGGNFTRGYRLDSLERASLTGKGVDTDLATARGGEQFVNKIESAYTTMSELANSPDATPAIKRINKQLFESGKPSSKTIKELEQLIKNPDDLARLCGLFGLQ